jgi:NitT/TauT family transport system permease protein
MSDLRQAWTPNGHVSRRVHAYLLAGTLVAIVAGWSGARPAFIPGPMDVLRAYPSLLDQGLASQLFVSLTTNFQAIALTCLLTIPLAYLTVLPAVRPFARLLAKMRFLGLTGFVMLFTLLFGGGDGLKLGLLVFGMGVFLLTTLYDIVEAIPREEFDHARTMRMSTWGALIEVVVRGHKDAVIDAVRQNCAMLWVMVTLVEGLVRYRGGLGAMMLTEDKHMHLDSVFAIQLVVLVIGMAQDGLFVLMRRVLCPYASLTLERQ